LIEQLTELRETRFQFIEKDTNGQMDEEGTDGGKGKSLPALSGRMGHPGEFMCANYLKGLQTLSFGQCFIYFMEALLHRNE
jgi:hypothetical protein